MALISRTWDGQAMADGASQQAPRPSMARQRLSNITTDRERYRSPRPPSIAPQPDPWVYMVAKSSLRRRLSEPSYGDA